MAEFGLSLFLVFAGTSFNIVSFHSRLLGCHAMLGALRDIPWYHISFQSHFDRAPFFTTSCFSASYFKAGEMMIFYLRTFSHIRQGSKHGDILVQSKGLANWSHQNSPTTICRGKVLYLICLINIGPVLKMTTWVYLTDTPLYLNPILYICHFQF